MVAATFINFIINEKRIVENGADTDRTVYTILYLYSIEESFHIYRRFC